VGTELLHEDGHTTYIQTDRQTDGRTCMTKVIVASSSFAIVPKGTHIVQADSGSDFDSKSRRQSAQRMSYV